jgi:hypothetical protein
MELLKAVEVIQKKFNKKLSMIEFEDGSGYKFNYQFFGERDKKFIDLKSK